MPDPSPNPREVDLHGLDSQRAFRRLEQELHAAKVRGETRLLVITGRGWGNREQKPILRQKTEAWLKGPRGQALGVKSFQVTQKGGALLLMLKAPSGG